MQLFKCKLLIPHHRKVLPGLAKPLYGQKLSSGVRIPPLRQQVFIIREVTIEAPLFAYLAAICASLSPQPVAEKFPSGFLERKPSKSL